MRARQRQHPEEGPAPLPLGPLRATAQRALAPGWSHAFGWTVLVGAISVAALLLAVRTELGNVAADDVPGYVVLASELGVVPEFEEFQAATAYELDSYRDLLDRHDIAESDVPQLLLAGEAEARALLALRADQGQLDAGVETIGGGPWPFPALPPLRLDSLTGVGALVGLTALLGAIGLVAMGGRLVAVRALGALLVAAALPVGAGLIARSVVGGNAGWEFVAGAALAALLAGLALAARGGGERGRVAEAGLMLAVALAASGAVIAPALVAIQG